MKAMPPYPTSFWWWVGGRLLEWRSWRERCRRRLVKAVGGELEGEAGVEEEILNPLDATTNRNRVPGNGSECKGRSLYHAPLANVAVVLGQKEAGIARLRGYS